ncbi:MULTISPECIES: chaplin family protein [unclassified Streptomyces]|uniref:chaplin family protein n=1 Tax=unclassified Streptomyces TaxID=2593676 RepID=UPI002E2FE952|nr:chaplin family protein [Streptomyces sp. NBC_01460]WSS30084.1 chaplin family protein [Streptomyces sp. NBC_01185]
MKNLKKAAAVTMIAGGLVAAGAGAASATGHGHGGAAAHGQAVGSPGVASGNLVQVPVHVPVNVVGNTVNVIGLLNPAFGNLGLNG